MQSYRWTCSTRLTLFSSFFRSYRRVYRERNLTFQPRVSRVNFVIASSTVTTFVFIPVFVSLCVLTIATVAIFGVILVSIVVAWLLGLLASFLVWFLLYRIPVYDIIYPRISYVWGITMFPYKIKVNGNDFYVTYNLFSALRQLRRPDGCRLVWIDAIRINQFDNVEKSNQVRLMKTIYSKASKVIVWLGTGSKLTAAAFNLVRQFGDTRTEEDRYRLWANVTSSWGWWRIQMELKRIVSHEWWSLAWIVQEVVVARHVVARRGPAQLPYDPSGPIHIQALQERVIQSAVSADFSDGVQQLRDELSSDNATPITLFDLVYNFRHQLATLGSDKIYALHGLLPPGCATRVSPDYSKSPDEVFLDFTLASLAEDKTFSVVALAPGCALQGAGWCRDWRILNDGFGLSPFEPFSMYEVPLSNEGLLYNW